MKIQYWWCKSPRVIILDGVALLLCERTLFGWLWLVLICCERKILLAGCWPVLIWCERKTLWLIASRMEWTRFKKRTYAYGTSKWESKRQQDPPTTADSRFTDWKEILHLGLSPFPSTCFAVSALFFLGEISRERARTGRSTPPPGFLRGRQVDPRRTATLRLNLR